MCQTNLPFQSTPLVGRKREIADILRAIRNEGVRLFTVTGPGGIGKTRLALQVAAELGDGFPAGVWFVDLSALRDPARIEPTIAAALGAKQSLREHLGDQHLLLVLDNFEQLAEGVGTITELLAACQRLTLLITSREALHVRAEREYPLRPLSEAPAVELFRERAGAVVPAFEASYEDLARICSRLDDLPLAIELAAARVKVLAPAALLERLEQRLPLLTGGPRDAPERQRTLSATIAWSHDLLGSDEQLLFRRLAIFAGGWTLEAAEQVCGAELDTLQSLVDKSLVRHDEDRYAMLETIREYAAARLEEASDAERIRARHAEYFVALAERAEPELTGPEQPAWLARLADEYQNLRQAFQWSLDRGQHGMALRIAAGLVLFWYLRGRYREGLDWLADVTGKDDASAAGRKALWGDGLMSVLAGDEQRGAVLLERHLALARAAGDRSGEARSLDVLGLLAFFANDVVRARDMLEASVRLAREAGDLWCLADSLGTLSSIYPLQGELDAGLVAGTEALEVARGNTDQHGTRMALFGLALTAIRREDAPAADEHASEGLSLSREMGDLWFISYFQWIIAEAAASLGDVDRAQRYADDSLEVAGRLQVPLLLTCALQVRARIALERGDRDEARRDLEAALETSALGGVPRSYISAVLLTLGRLQSLDGEAELARRSLSEAARVAEEVGDSLAAAKARAVLASSSTA